ncbi:sperm-associated antigen 5-like [Heteronotia binoei]|uniref:sperm-associated antigen 5-like n=1 Tax=Heteronotia binoei TaxID=13085 RepID=UPI00292F80B9|nr:sperm-associated antigen 5-like [Heteronotia binoei]
MEEPPVGLEETPVTSLSELVGTMSPCANSWMTSLAWLEQSIPDSPALETLHQSLSALFSDKATATTPVSMASVATWKTPPSLLEAGVNTSPREMTSAGDSNRETDSLLGHHSRHQLSDLSRPELEGCLEGALVIIEVFSHHLQTCQEHQRPAAQVAATEQRDATTQAPGECSDASKILGRLRQAMQQNHEAHSLAKRMTAAIEEMQNQTFWVGSFFRGILCRRKAWQK